MAGGAGYANLLMPRSGAEAARLGGLRPPTASTRVLEPENGSLAFVLYGDSHANQYLDAAVERFGPGALVSESGCLSVGGLSNQVPDDPEGAACRALEQRLAELVGRRGIDTVIWAQLWDRRLYGPDSANLLGTTGAQGGPYLLAAMERFAESLPADVRIIIIGNSPTAWAAGPALERGWLRCRAWRNVACPESYPAVRAEGRKVNAMLRAFAAADPRYSYVDAQEPLCPDRQCLLLQNGQLNYWDGSHMTIAAARRVMATIPRASMHP